MERGHFLFAAPPAKVPTSRRGLQKCPRCCYCIFMCATRALFKKCPRLHSCAQSAPKCHKCPRCHYCVFVSTTRALSGSLYGVNVRTVDTFRRFGPNARVHPKVTTVCTSTFVTTSQLYGHRGHFPFRGRPAGTFLRRCPRPRDRDFPRFPARDPWALCKNRVRNSGPGGTFCNVHTAGTFAKNAESVHGLNCEIMGPNPGTAGTFGKCGFWEVPAPPRLGARHGNRGHILKGAHGSVARISRALFSSKSADRATAGTFRRFGKKRCRRQKSAHGSTPCPRQKSGKGRVLCSNVPTVPLLDPTWALFAPMWGPRARLKKCGSAGKKVPSP